MLTLAQAILDTNTEARRARVHATVGRVEVEPNATNAIPARVSAWLDARAEEPAALRWFVDTIHLVVARQASVDGIDFALTEESASPTVEFDPGLRARIAKLLGGAPVIGTGAGHDAGVLAAHVPTAMLFVRNPTGVSHSPAESASDADCAAGVEALADVLEDLACR
jgi:N-carbamoyl-L-amino-acid hydrolase